MVNAMLECLLGIKGYKQGQPIQREKGILGIIEAYIGTVEAQGWGTLHLHTMLWLWGGITADRMKECLSTEEFRSKVKRFIAMNIRADLPDVHRTDVLSICHGSGRDAYLQGRPGVARPSDTSAKNIGGKECRESRRKNVDRSDGSGREYWRIRWTHHITCRLEISMLITGLDMIG